VKQAKGIFLEEGQGDVLSDVQEGCFGMILKTTATLATICLLIFFFLY
jgi:hypothetical protein